MFETALTALVSGFTNLTWQQSIMILLGSLLLFLAVARGIEPLLLIPIGFGAILGNLPITGLTDNGGILNILFKAGIQTELFPSLLFIGLGAMIDFGPMLANPSVLLFGAAGQFGIFLTLFLALLIGFTRPEAVSIGIIGAMDGPTAIFVTTKFAPHMLAAVSVAAYSYMSLVPIIQPPIMKFMTTKKERDTRMPYGEKKVSQKVKILFPVVVGILTILIAPMGAPLMGMLMLGNFLRESQAVSRLTKASENEIANIVTLFLGVVIGSTMVGETFLTWQTILIFVLGFIAICLDTVTGVTLGKVMCIITKGKVNPLLGAAGTSAFPMSARVVQKEGQKYNPRNFLLWHAMGANTGGQIGSVMAAAVILAIMKGMGY